MPSGAAGVVGGGLGVWRDRGHLAFTESGMARFEDPGIGAVRDMSGRGRPDLHARKPGGGTSTELGTTRIEHYKSLCENDSAVWIIVFL